MTYRPSLSDIYINSNASQNSYRPSLSDIDSPPNDDSFNRMANLNPQSSIMHSMPNKPMTMQDAKNAMLRGSGALLMGMNPELMPEAGALSKGINALGRIGTGTTGGTLMNMPNMNSLNDLGKTVGENALLNTGLESIFPALGLAKKVISLAEPQKYAEQFINKLSGGQDLENTGKYISSNINNAYNLVKEKFKKKYDDLFNSYGSVGNNGIYNRTEPIIGTYKPTEFENLNLSEDDFKDKKLFNKYNDFLKDPSLNKAHDLQSELGNKANLLKSNKFNPDHDTINNLMDVRSLLQQDIHNYMGSVHEDLPETYKKIGQDYKREVVPYYSDNTLNDMATGKLENPSREKLITLFRNPDNDINKILEHQSPDFKNKILHVLLGQEKETVTPQSLQTALKPFGKKGLNTYKTPEINNALNSIANRQALQNLLKRGAGTLGGFLLGHLSGNPTIEALATVGGFGGAPNASHLLKYPFSKFNLSGKSEPITNALRSSFKPAARLLGSNALANQ